MHSVFSSVIFTEERYLEAFPVYLLGARSTKLSFICIFIKLFVLLLGIG